MGYDSGEAGAGVDKFCINLKNFISENREFITEDGDELICGFEQVFSRFWRNPREKLINLLAGNS